MFVVLAEISQQLLDGLTLNFCSDTHVSLRMRLKFSPEPLTPRKISNSKIINILQWNYKYCHYFAVPAHDSSVVVVVVILLFLYS